jgi:hypothetical protein
MPATFIPVTGLNLGPVGAVSQSDFPLRTPRQVNPTDTRNIAFGETAVLNANNTYSSVAQFIQNGGTVTGSTPIGLAAANTRTNPTFPMAGSGGSMMPGGYYAPGNIADVMTQGTMNVVCNNGTPSAGSAVYVRTAANPLLPSAVVGGLEAVADPNPVNTTGTASANSTTLTVASGSGIVAGQLVAGAGIAPGTSVISVSGTTVTLSQPTTAALSNTAVTFTSNVLIPYMKWKTGFLGSDGTAQVTIVQRQIP